MEQALSRGYETGPQTGLGVGCKLCSSIKKLRGLGESAQARRIRISLSYLPDDRHVLLPSGHGDDSRGRDGDPAWVACSRLPLKTNGDSTAPDLELASAWDSLAPL